MIWSNWKPEDIGIKVKGAPAVSSWKEGRLDVFVCSTTNHLYHRVYENDKWQGDGWRDLSDGHKIEVSPGVVSWGPNRIDLFAVWDKQVHHRSYQDGHWNAWAENLEGITTDAPAAASWKKERVDVLVRTTDNRMSRRFWEIGRYAVRAEACSSPDAVTRPPVRRATGNMPIPRKATPTAAL